MADYTKHFEIYDGIFRIRVPGYDPGPGPGNGTFGGLGKAMIDVIVGDKYAAVWDTGNGDIDLLGYIRQNITTKPLIVLNSHGHVDHARGDNQFEEVWINEADLEMAKSALAIENFHGHPCCEAVKASKGCTFKFVEEGQIFDLGGRTLKIVFAPGHSKGSMCAVESKSRVLFSGDAVLKRVGLSVTRQEYRKVLEKLKKEDFDVILCGHWDLPLDREQLDRFIKIIDDFTPAKAVRSINTLGGTESITYQSYIGTEFADPDFASISMRDPDFFWGEH